MATERREATFPNPEIPGQQGLAGVENRGRLSPSWEEILADDPDHEKHLETPQGRLQATLNIAKNGAMVLEVMVMDRNWQGYRDVTRRVKEICGFGVTKNAIVTSEHLVQTISTVGAAARSDINDNDWQLTPFGEAIKPALIYTWQKFLEQDINPAKALTSISSVKKDQDGNLVDSAPYSRSKILLALARSGQMREVEFVTEGGITDGSVQNHLTNLKEAGLVNFESADAIDSYTFFKLTDKGKLQAKRPVFKDSQGKNQLKLTSIVELAITALAVEGKETFTTSDIVNWIKVNVDNPGSAKHLAKVNSVLNFFSKADVGLLQRSELNFDNMSMTLLTDKGQAFVQEILKPLEVWAWDPIAVSAIGEIRQNIKRNPDAYQDIYRQIATIFRETSPHVNRNIEAKREMIRAAIAKNSGQTAFDIARKLGISYQTVRNGVKPLIACGQVQVEVGKGGRKHYSMAGQEKRIRPAGSRSRLPR